MNKIPKKYSSTKKVSSALGQISLAGLSIPRGFRSSLGGVPKMGAPQWLDGLFHENPIKMDDWGVPLFQETPIFALKD